jgi:starch-binding outer membrane protein, SusD/RagB family
MIFYKNFRICSSIKKEATADDTFYGRLYKQTVSLCIFFIASIFFISVTSCKKFVEIDPPQTQLVTASVFNNSASATAALTNIYTQMYTNTTSYKISQSTGLLSDELKNYSTRTPQTQYYANAMVATQTNGEWSNAYSYIYQANAIIEALENSTTINSTVVNQLTGEAKFIRAFWHFYLVNAYGDVPLVTTTDYTVNGTIARTPKIEVFQQIITDLKDAQNLLNSNFVDASNTNTTADRVRPTKWAATALLARAYLYTGDWANAEAQSTVVIANISQFGLEPDLNKVFLKNSKETVWQLATPLPANNQNTQDGFFYIRVGAPSTANNGSSTLSAQLLNSFESSDQRKVNWVSSLTVNGNTHYFPYKYKVRNASTISEYTMVLRLAELYLIRAEARAQQNNISGAQSDLNAIRTRAGLSNITAGTQSGLLSAILQERKVELFTEWGHRWFDLIRTNNINSVMSLVAPLKGTTWNSDGTQTLYPIPQKDRDSNPNLSQNLGY